MLFLATFLAKRQNLFLYRAGQRYNCDSVERLPYLRIEQNYIFQMLQILFPSAYKIERCVLMLFILNFFAKRQQFLSSSGSPLHNAIQCYVCLRIKQ